MSILDLWRHFWSEKTSFFAFYYKNDQVWQFWMPFKPKLSWKKLFSLMSLTFWEKNFRRTMSIFDVWRHFWSEKTSFLRFWQKMANFDPFKCLLSQNCLIKSCSVWWPWPFEKKIFVVLCLFLTYDIIFCPKRRFFCVFWQKWPVLTVLIAF